MKAPSGTARGEAHDLLAGRRAFGADPLGYDTARPAYPEQIFELLVTRCGLVPGTPTFEVGPGTGLATRRLLELGADPLVAIEPDERLATYLAESVRLEAPTARFEVRVSPFEEVSLPLSFFGLGAAATSFHWLEQAPALAKVVTLLRPGGWWAMWWTVYGDPDREDPFRDATDSLLRTLGGTPSLGGAAQTPFALDVDERIADLEAAGLQSIEVDQFRWRRTFSPDEIRALYATFSPLRRLSEEARARLLDDLARIAEEEFGGGVMRPLVTAIYTSRRAA